MNNLYPGRFVSVRILIYQNYFLKYFCFSFFLDTLLIHDIANGNVNVRLETIKLDYSKKSINTHRNGKFLTERYFKRPKWPIKPRKRLHNKCCLVFENSVLLMSPK